MSSYPFAIFCLGFLSLNFSFLNTLRHCLVPRSNVVLHGEMVAEQLPVP
ncbi:MAG: hypothetical protein M1526_00070 [Candidatus Thermoplasmatota archaeon]|nr:hypothetical protein [Candidatus Thermoplasmatota archaeon]